MYGKNITSMEFGIIHSDSWNVSTEGKWGGTTVGFCKNMESVDISI